MKIVTVNVPIAYVDAMQGLTGEEGIYPSRSELIRNAVRKFLEKELHKAKKVKNKKEKNRDPNTIEYHGKTLQILRKIELDKPSSSKRKSIKAKKRSNQKREPLGNIFWHEIRDGIYQSTVDPHKYHIEANIEGQGILRGGEM